MILLQFFFFLNTLKIHENSAIFVFSETCGTDIFTPTHNMYLNGIACNIFSWHFFDELNFVLGARDIMIYECDNLAINSFLQ